MIRIKAIRKIEEVVSGTQEGLRRRVEPKYEVMPDV
jgi:hypothetical protein